VVSQKQTNKQTKICVYGGNGEHQSPEEVITPKLDFFSPDAGALEMLAFFVGQYLSFFTFAPCMLLHLLYAKPTHALLLTL
jgi:hypothetical protein